jgi:hypothetical protein
MCPLRTRQWPTGTADPPPASFSFSPSLPILASFPLAVSYRRPLFAIPGLGVLPFFPSPPRCGGGVPRREIGGVAVGVGEGTLNGDSRLRRTLYHRVLRLASSRAFSSLLRSNAARYRSYPSLNDLSTREENISSPRGLVDGGMVASTVDVVLCRLWVSGLAGGTEVRAGGCEGRKKGIGKVGFGRRMLRCMFNGRSALFEWLMYLEV